MQLIIAGVDYSQRYDSVTLTGKIGVCARTLTVGILVSNMVAALAAPTIPSHSAVVYYDDDGTLVFQGIVVQTHRDSKTSTISITCMDYGYFLVQNTGWYDFLSTTAEAAVEYIARDIGLSVESLAVTNAKISRNFAGVALHKIIDTLYTLASETTGGRYHIRFSGSALQVVEKPSSSDIYLDPAANVYTSTNTIDVTDYCNTVDIHDETGTLIRTVGGSEELAGLLRQHITQLDGEDAIGEAEQLIEDGSGTQSVVVTCPGDLRLVTGNAVVVRETAAGVEGLFWIDADTHTWSNGQYNVTLDLNFRNLMNDTTSGTE